MRNIWFTLHLILSIACSRAPGERENIFRYNESMGIASLDPAFARNQTVIWPVNQLFNGLVQLDRELNVVPCIAHSWEISEDGKVYTFHLRDDVYFHDDPYFPGGKGRGVTASDFVSSLKRIMDPEVASPGAWIFNSIDRSENNDFTGFRAIGDSILRIWLQRPFPAFLGLLTMPYCFVVPPEIVEQYGADFRNHPVGTGPFRFKVWREDEKLVLVRNDNYFELDETGRRLPYLDAVNITFTRDKQSEFMEFMMGRLDFLSGVHPVYKDELITRGGILNPVYSGRIQMITEPYLNTEYLGFLMDPTQDAVDGSPVLDRRIRQAINYGFDRVKMMKFLRNNIGTPATGGFIPAGMPSFREGLVDGYSYQPDRARELLSLAGYPRGEGLPEITLTTTSDYLDLCEYIQHELSEVGIRIKIEVNTGASFRNRMANSHLEFFRGSWIADYPDAENYLSLFYSRNFSPAGPNYTHFSNPSFDSLFVESLNTVDRDLRHRMYRALDQMVMDESPVVPLYYDQVVRFVPVNLEGLGSNPMNLLSLKNAYWSK
jgi:peptide/nickel transport system substrate-binding protein